MTRALRSVFAGVMSVCVIGAFHYWRLPDAETTDTTSEQPTGASHADTQSQQAPSPFDTRSASSDDLLATINASKGIRFSSEVATLIEAGDFVGAKRKLLELASVAVEAEDHLTLARLLSELGELALLQTDIDAAELYLAEALDVFLQLGDEVSTAGVFMQFGRLHLLARERARQASDAYDQLLVARWKISHNQFDQAEQQLKQIVSTNLKLNRYGAAASAYETLFSGYSKAQQFDQAQRAGLEAARLHAASGRVFQARVMLGRMREQGISETVFEGFEQEIEQLTQEFDDSVNAIAMAKDQEQLYNQLLARGDVVQAWRFREKAGKSLARASVRAQYRRQPDVLVELYRSNDSMENARASLQRAREVYMRHGLESEVRRSESLQESIY